MTTAICAVERGRSHLFIDFVARAKQRPTETRIGPSTHVPAPSGPGWAHERGHVVHQGPVGHRAIEMKDAEDTAHPAPPRTVRDRVEGPVSLMDSWSSSNDTPSCSTQA
jgi:hypothetical protein